MINKCMSFIYEISELSLMIMLYIFVHLYSILVIDWTKRYVRKLVDSWSSFGCFISVVYKQVSSEPSQIR